MVDLSIVINDYKWENQNELVGHDEKKFDYGTFMGTSDGTILEIWAHTGNKMVNR